MLVYLEYAFALIVTISLIFFGWKASDWHNRSLEADKLEQKIEATRKMWREAELKALRTSIVLGQKESIIRSLIEEARKDVAKSVDPVDCSLGVVGVRALNKARGAMPSSATGTAAATGKTDAVPGGSTSKVQGSADGLPQ